MQWRMSTRRIQRGSRKIGNHIQFTSVATKSTSKSRRSVRRSLADLEPWPLAARTCTSASENPAARMKAGATSPSIHCSASKSRSLRSSGRRSTSECVWIITSTARPRSQSKARTRIESHPAPKAMLVNLAVLVLIRVTRNAIAREQAPGTRTRTSPEHQYDQEHEHGGGNGHLTD